MDIYEEDANLTYEQVWDEASKYIYIVYGISNSTDRAK